MLSARIVCRGRRPKALKILMNRTLRDAEEPDDMVRGRGARPTSSGREDLTLNVI